MFILIVIPVFLIFSFAIFCLIFLYDATLSLIAIFSFLFSSFFLLIQKFVLYFISIFFPPVSVLARNFCFCALEIRKFGVTKIYPCCFPFLFAHAVSEFGYSTFQPPPHLALAQIRILYLPTSPHLALAHRHAANNHDVYPKVMLPRGRCATFHNFFFCASLKSFLNLHVTRTTHVFYTGEIPAPTPRTHTNKYQTKYVTKKK